jgi:hypothetical protein
MWWFYANNSGEAKRMIIRRSVIPVSTPRALFWIELAQSGIIQSKDLDMMSLMIMPHSPGVPNSLPGLPWLLRSPEEGSI